MNNGNGKPNKIYNINGNFNKSISVGANYLEVHGNYINNTQDLSQVISQIQDLLNQLEKQGYSSQEAQQKVANHWVNEVQNNPNTKGKLVKLGKYISDVGTSAVVGEATLSVIRLIFASLGIPLPF
ncbi:hypothetical protein H6G74_30070 [Nostoc spongiaeforme FACHB-130]|uniref:Uncharacterized protein n=1 Tax=Nostoc spongiaeforme FACHB-130 TaxID=1357510 RepID=A0ABR8G5H6_9NOSO|nr:hypothetical protein [Nostoc spongiaeforme]MBD2598511.1 hypothetical protein [Nostoc spongiaeforme FACHB-130]